MTHTDTEDLVESFLRIRSAICELEHFIGTFGDQGDDIKEYDKAVVVMKAGAKIMKKRLRELGYTKLGKRAKARVQ